MSNEIKSREVVVALPESYELRPNKDETKPPVINLTVRVVEGPTTGREERLFLHLTGGAAEISIKQLRALGMTNNDVTAPEGLGSVRADMTGKDEEYQGKVSRRYSIWAAKARPSLRAEDQKAFAAKFREMAAGLEKVTIADHNRAPESLPAASNGTTAQKFDSSDTGSSATDLFR